MPKETIWLSSPHVSGNELKYIREAFSNNLLLPKGSNLIGFETDIANYINSPNVACVMNGTAAIHLALIGLGVEQGDEVICSTFTFSASANPIVYQKATPVFVDSEIGAGAKKPRTKSGADKSGSPPGSEVTRSSNSTGWNMSPELLEEAVRDRIRKGKKPKAIIPVHLYGMPARMDEIMEIARRYEIPVVEDAAEALGSKFEGQACGTFGDIGVLSFNGNKIITTSGGGALVSKDKKFTNLARFLGTQARDPFPHYEHSHIGYNYRMSNICAGIGRGQMEVLDDYIAKRRENHFFYAQALKDLDGISLLEEPDERFYSNFWLTTILVDPEKTGGITREDIRIQFEKLGIETRPLWKPMHLQPVFKDCPAYVDGTSEGLFDVGLCLPSSSNISDEDRAFVAESLINILAVQ